MAATFIESFTFFVKCLKNKSMTFILLRQYLISRGITQLLSWKVVNLGPKTSEIDFYNRYFTSLGNLQPVINVSVVVQERVWHFFLHPQQNLNANLFHSSPQRSHSETSVSIKHWLFSKTQCCLVSSYPSGSGDSRSYSLPHSPQLEQKLKGNLHREMKKRQNYCFARVVAKY